MNNNKRDALVSVIVPVYNAEEYLSICLKSIINQTYKNLQIIIINDGSTDSSKKICDDFAEMDRRIVVIHNANCGVSYTRNLGIEKADGQFICFVDADDWLEPDFIGVFLSDFNNDIDVVYGGYAVFRDEEKIDVISDNVSREFALDNQFDFNSKENRKREI